MQPVTVAISPTGVQYLLKSLLGDQIAQALQTMTEAPSYQFQPGDFQYSFDQGGTAYRNDYSNIAINILPGQFQAFSPVFSGAVQGPNDNSQFTITMTVSNLEADYPSGWNETYSVQEYWYSEPDPCGGGTGVWYPNGPSKGCNNTYNYSVQVPSLTITAIFELSASGGSYELTYVSSGADAGNPQPNIPGQSILNQLEVSCGVGAHISTATKDALGKMDWSGAFAQTLNKVFASIGESGQLGPVTFDFLAPGDTPLQFPTSGGGIQIGAKGSVSVNGSAFPQTPPADLPFPQVPTGNPPPHVTYWVQDYEVNALFWGFFKAGVLKTTVTKDNIMPQADQIALWTDTYASTIPNLDSPQYGYPQTWMTADLWAEAAPITAFQTIYQINEENLPSIQKALSAVWSSVGTALEKLSNMTYSSQDGFENVLKAISKRLPVSFEQYIPAIEQYAGMPGVVVTHTTRCALNVPNNGGYTPVITFDVAQSFVMQDLQLGESSVGSDSGPTQSVIFTLIQPFDGLPQVSFVSSTIYGIDGGDFAIVWDGLYTNWQRVFNDIALAGLPLPRIPGFDFLFGTWAANALTAISWSGGVVTATTTTAHGVQVGQQFQISGVAPSGYNGTFAALADTTGNTLVYALATNPGTETVLGTLVASALIKVIPPVAGADGYISITTNVIYSPQNLAPAVREMLSKQKTLRVA